MSDSSDRAERAEELLARMVDDMPAEWYLGVGDAAMLILGLVEDVEEGGMSVQELQEAVSWLVVDADAARRQWARERFRLDLRCRLRAGKAEGGEAAQQGV